MEQKAPQSELKKNLAPTKTRLSRTLHPLAVVAFYLVLYLIFFSPVIFFGRLLAPGDAKIQSIPAFYAARTLWTPLLSSGFPVAADPTVQTWYPLSILFSSVNSWNAFVISAYVLSSCFVYGYVYSLNRSRLAGFVAGIVYGMSAFMMAHLGHTTMIHTAVWLPLLIWALERLRHNVAAHWYGIGVLSITMGALAGHPQILVYTLGIGTAYVTILGCSGPVRPWKYYGLFLSVMILGLGLAAIQLLPTAELTRLGMRHQMSFAMFNDCSLHPYQSIALLFPYLLGGIPGSIYGPYFGPCNVHELSGYIGLLPLILAGVGFLAYLKRSMVWFWTVVGLIGFLLTLGDATPLAKLMYYLPAYNKFRVPSRHFMEVAFAVSVLAGFGVTAIQNQTIMRRTIFKIILVDMGVMLIGLSVIYIFSNKLQGLAISSGIGKTALQPWSNPAIGLPLVIFLAVSIALIFWSKRPYNSFHQIFLLFILVIDLGSFGWFISWKYASPSKQLLEPPAVAEKYKMILNKHNQRLLPIRGALGSVSELPPNISRLWGVPSASGCGPLLLKRIMEVLSTDPAGVIYSSWDSGFDRSLDIMSIRYVLIPKREVYKPIVLESNGFSWLTIDLPFQMGPGCNAPHSNSIEINLLSPFNATTIGIVSAMACSTNIANNVEVVRIRITDKCGNFHTQSILAGRDTSEWAYDCSNARSRIQHQRAPIFKSFPSGEDSSGSCEGHHYLSVHHLGKRIDVKNLELLWVGPAGLIAIKKISLLDEQTGLSYPVLAPGSSLLDNTRWHRVEDMGEVSAYENKHAMPRVWLVPEVVSTKPEEIYHAIKSSQVPDGRNYDPYQIALVEEPFTFKTKNLDKSATAQVVHLEDTKIEVLTNSTSPSFLVLSDVYYPGWKATIDGIETHLFKTNYVLRGIMVPAGGHMVRFEFRPKSFYLGAGISAISLFLLGLLFFRFPKKWRIIPND